MITTRNVGDALVFLLRDEGVFTRLQNDFPDILADLVSFKNNPNCSCRSRVNKFFIDKLQQFPDILEQYITDAIALQNELNNLEALRRANNYSGRYFVIPKGEQSWSDFSNGMQGKMFRGFSVVERDNEIVVYIL